MFFNPIEIICTCLIQPIIDFLVYLMDEVHYLAFLAGLAFLGIFLGLIFGIISVIWYKSTRDVDTKKCYAEERVSVSVGARKSD
ncbi:uncharacterized protein LOC108048326 [Drosophila rhopaloa]|uniref:Uncharacterized protein LOC108048326 n=1 Tax=Drosophila rhopaloa TaxID=1041015 RepID=A0A6P4FAL7_DRORH|nr:uncharacterized protein LOC108048326 [Drosophila rhopaloa]